jgi:hypothetical protein
MLAASMGCTDRLPLVGHMDADHHRKHSQERTHHHNPSPAMQMVSSVGKGNLAGDENNGQNAPNVEGDYTSR